MKLQSAVQSTWLNPLPGMVLDWPHINPHFSVCSNSFKSSTWEEKFDVCWGMLVSAITHMHCFLSRFVQWSLSTPFMFCYLVGFAFSGSWLMQLLMKLWCFLYLHFSADSPWLERQELSEITFLNLFWHADQSLITHLLCVIPPVYLPLKAKLSSTPLCQFVLSFFLVFSLFVILSLILASFF